MSTTHSDYVKGKRLGVFQGLRTVLEYLGAAIDAVIDNATTAASTVSTLSARVTDGIQYADVTISAAAIVGTSAGQLGHASGVSLVAAQGANTYIELLGAVVKYNYDTAAYTGGGNVTVNVAGGSALTGLISAANSLGASADKVVQFVPLATAGINLTANTAINLVAASAFTQPGTAAGTVTVRTYYRVHTQA